VVETLDGSNVSCGYGEAGDVSLLVPLDSVDVALLVDLQVLLGVKADDGVEFPLGSDAWVAERDVSEPFIPCRIGLCKYVLLKSRSSIRASATASSMFLIFPGAAFTAMTLGRRDVETFRLLPSAIPANGSVSDGSAAR